MEFHIVGAVTSVTIQMRNDFISAYFSYIGETEAPMTFHRWACITVLGAWIGREYCFRFGHFNIKPNIYCMLMGSAGSRKSTAIKIASRLLSKTGYNTIAADRTTKEKFLLDLSGAPDVILDTKGKQSLDATLEENLFGGLGDENHVPEMLIAADEFNTFVGNGNIEFLSMLGVLWDHEGTFKNKVKNSKSVELHNPFVSIIAGNTPTGFSLAFPAESIGQGIFSRIILVHGEPTGKRITFPESPSPESTKEIVEILHTIRTITQQDAVITDGAKSLLDAIYKTVINVSDVRFESYLNRRFSHLIKLCLVISASAMRSVIEECDVIYANTILTHTEHSMSKALGEFGKARHSDVSHKLISILESSYEPIPIKQLWIQLHNDLEDISSLKDMLISLVMAEKVLSTQQGYLIKRKVFEEVSTQYVDFSLLTEEERKYIS
jgi:hypothetical protein